jgi:hypothetical protein
MKEFICLYNFNGYTVLYKRIKNQPHDLNIKLKHYIANNDTNKNKLYIITDIINYNVEIDFKFITDKNIFILQTDIQFELFYYTHNLRHNYFYKNNIVNSEKILTILNELSDSFDKYPTMRAYSRKQEITSNLENDLVSYKDIINVIKTLDKDNKIYDKLIENDDIKCINYYNELLNEIHYFLQNNIECFINNIVNFKEFANIYNFNTTNLIYSSCISNNVTLRNVYYINKCWFDKDKNPLQINEFENDMEYKMYKKFTPKITDITNYNIFQTINEEVMYLDYIYGFYNFGEFWDVIKRLIVTDNQNLPLFHLSHNRITNINYYFDKLGYQFPTKYNTQENNNKLYYFNKVNIPCIKSVGCRGLIDNHFAYQFNKKFNKSTKVANYNIYLSRGIYGRSIINEEKIVNVLKEKYNFIILNGSESLEDTIDYFTNAKIIFAPHGSLQKNMIWAKHNPILIELCPPSRANLDMYGNARALNFVMFFIVLENNEKEEIILNEKNINDLYKLLDALNL